MDILKWFLTSHGCLIVQFLDRDRKKQFACFSVHSDLAQAYFWSDMRFMDEKTAEDIRERHKESWQENRFIPKAESIK